MEVAEVRVVETGVARSLYALERFGIQSEALVKMAECELLQGIARVRKCFMPHAGQRRIGFAHAAQAVCDAQDEPGIRRQRVGSAGKLNAGITQSALGE